MPEDRAYPENAQAGNRRQVQSHSSKRLIVISHHSQTPSKRKPN